MHGEAGKAVVLTEVIGLLVIDVDFLKRVPSYTVLFPVSAEERYMVIEMGRPGAASAG